MIWRASMRALSRRASHCGGDGSVDEDDAVDELGPVDWLVVEFPGSRFNGEIAPALDDLVECLELRGCEKDTGIIRQEVVAELMTTGHNLPHEILVPRGADADEEERGPRPVAAQKIDKAGVVAGCGPSSKVRATTLVLDRTDHTTSPTRLAARCRDHMRLPHAEGDHP